MRFVSTCNNDFWKLSDCKHLRKKVHEKDNKKVYFIAIWWQNRANRKANVIASFILSIDEPAVYQSSHLCVSRQLI